MRAHIKQKETSKNISPRPTENHGENIKDKTPFRSVDRDKRCETLSPQTAWVRSAGYATPRRKRGVRSYSARASRGAILSTSDDG